MIMSANTMLAPREDSDFAIDREAGGAAVGGLDRYRAWVSDHKISAALVAAVVATHMATVIGYWMPGIGLPQLDWNRINGTIYTPTASSDGQFLSGGFFHYVDGIVFTLVFVIAVYPLLRWRSTTFGNALKGLFFGTILATISCAFMIPRVYFPDAHVGFFSHNLGWKLILAVYVWHWVYGLNLGMIYNPSPRDDRVTTRDRQAIKSNRQSP
jgi:hypothetical protein